MIIFALPPTPPSFIDRRMSYPPTQPSSKCSKMPENIKMLLLYRHKNVYCTGYCASKMITLLALGLHKATKRF